MIFRNRAAPKPYRCLLQIQVWICITPWHVDLLWCSLHFYRMFQSWSRRCLPLESQTDRKMLSKNWHLNSEEHLRNPLPVMCWAVLSSFHQSYNANQTGDGIFPIATRFNSLPKCPSCLLQMDGSLRREGQKWTAKGKDKIKCSHLSFQLYFQTASAFLELFSGKRTLFVAFSPVVHLGCKRQKWGM